MRPTISNFIIFVCCSFIVIVASNLFADSFSLSPPLHILAVLGLSAVGITVGVPALMRLPRRERPLSHFYWLSCFPFFAAAIGFALTATILLATTSIRGDTGVTIALSVGIIIGLVTFLTFLFKSRSN